MFVTALMAFALSAPVPKAKAVELYYPVTGGTKRVLGTAESEGGSTEEVTKVEEKDGVFTVTVTYTTPSYTMTRVYEVSAGKVVRWKGEERWTVFDTGARDGTWNVESKGKGRPDVTATFTTGKEEEIETPAGKFKAVPVTERWPHAEGEIVNTLWYAPGVGVVKQVSGSPVSTTVLKAFTPDKEEKK